MKSKVMKQVDTGLKDIAADSVGSSIAEEAALESHLRALHERLGEVEKLGDVMELAAAHLEIARTLVELDRGGEAWDLGRNAFDAFSSREEWEQAADACEVLFRANQPQSLSALGQGIWIGVTYPIDPELSITLLHHVVDETPPDSDGAAVAATTALFIADMRAGEDQQDTLRFFANQKLAEVARRHSQVNSKEGFEAWVQRLELNEPGKFLVRLRNVVDVLVQDDWWIDREALQARLPVN